MKGAIDEVVEAAKDGATSGRTPFTVEVLTPEGEVFNDEVEMVSTQDDGRLDRHPGQPRSRCSACSTRPSCGCTARRPTSCASRRARATCRSTGDHVLILVEEALDPTTLDAAELQDKLRQADAELEQAEDGTEEQRCCAATSAAGRRSSPSPRAAATH